MLPFQNTRCAALGSYMNLCEVLRLKTLWKKKSTGQKMILSGVVLRSVAPSHLCQYHVNQIYDVFFRFHITTDDI